MIGRTVSHYRIDAQLGAGGMGVVYRGEDVRLGRSVALKFVTEHLAHDEDAVRRLRAEARAASALNHPGICTIYDIDEIDGHPFIVMELLKGRPLRDLLANGPLRIHQLVDIGIEIADALQAAHSEGIVHRDITPGNIFVTDRGHVKILDFGLAKLATPRGDPTTTLEAAQKTAAGLTLGTVAYMSPEQATGEDLDGRTDLFSLGVVLYEAATGRHPFAAKTATATLAAILNRAPVAPVALNADVPQRLQEVINNCLEKDRELRYQSAGDLRADLKRVRRDVESGAAAVVVPAARAPRKATPIAPRRAMLWAGAAIVLSAAVGAGAFWLTDQRSEPQAPAPTPLSAPTVAEPNRPPTPQPSQPPAAPADAVGVTGTRRPAEERPSPRTTAPVAAPAARSAPAPSQQSPAPAAPATSPMPPSSQPLAAPLPLEPPPPPAQPAPAPPPPPSPETRERESRPAAPAGEDDDAAIRRVTANYARAIETKDLALFKTVKPNLSREEERRLQEGFRAVTSQHVALTIVSTDRKGDEASVKVRRRDTIQAAGRTQTVDSEQTLQLARSGGGWVLVAIR